MSKFEAKVPKDVMQKLSNCIESEKSYLCKVFHLNSQNLMLIGPLNDWATAYGSY